MIMRSTLSVVRPVSTETNIQSPIKTPPQEQNDQSEDQEKPIIVYEGPFALLSLRLKRISITSAVIGIVGLPLLSYFYGAGTVPATGQLAVVATAGITAVGSTAMLGYCFSPYVHRLERLPVIDDDDKLEKNDRSLVRAVTRDILAREVVTIFDPLTDINPPPANSSRPFCNFTVKGLPMYVHPELVHDDSLRMMLVGESIQKESKDEDVNAKKKLDDDEFL